MQAETWLRNGISKGFSADSVDGAAVGGSDSPPPLSLLPMPPGLNYIEHSVSKMDTLVGIAIKYGVEVADIKRMNGLVTDLQMFALKTLRIPLPGRHPPSPIISDGSSSSGAHSTEKTPNRRHIDDILDSFESIKLKSTPHRVSPAMNNLQNYYGLSPTNGKGIADGFEMVVYKTVTAQHPEDNNTPLNSPFSDPSIGRRRKCRSLANGFSPENIKLAEDIEAVEAVDSEVERTNEMSVRRRQKVDLNSASQTDLLLKEDCGSVFSGITGKGLALRPKTTSRPPLVNDADASWINPIPVAESSGDGYSGVRKSSSTSNLQDSENGSSIWPTSKWYIKPDLQALSTASITRPIFDSLPKPITGRRKAALD